MKRFYPAMLAAMFAVSLTACKKDPVNNNNDDDGISHTDTVQMTPYDLPHPVHFPKAVIPEDNKLYEERIALGKKLFFDNRLSNDGTSCESCHKQHLGFSMVGVSATDNGLTSLPLINLAWYQNFMWNGRIVGTLEDVMMKEITERFKTDMLKVNAIEEYRDLFKKYYNVTGQITEKDLSYALAQYMRILVSKDTRQELDFRGQQVLTPEEMAGKNLFFTEVSKGGADCFHCHVAVIGTDNMLHNNGLDSTYAKEIDKGLYNVTKNPADLGKFRTPNLRNVALRTHYMHDGRFTTLEEVVEFYNSGVRKVNNLDPLMAKPDKINGLNLTEAKKKQLVAYLKTFTDSTMITDSRFAAP